VTRLRVLHLVRYLSQTGGAERFALALATHLPKERFESWMCATRGGEQAPIDALAGAGIPFVSLGRKTVWDVHRLTGLAALLRRERFDVIHSHSFGMNFWATTIGTACGVHVLIAHEHTWSYRGNPPRMWIDGRIIGRLATRFIAVSTADAERMIRMEHVPADKVLVIPTAYVPSDAAGNGDIRAELGLPPGTPLLGTAAVFRAQKALEVLIQAHALVRKKVPNAHLVLAGDGPTKPQVEQLVDELGLGANVHFLGLREDVDSILRSLDVAAMSSDFEGSPLFAYECMANGTPLVATRVGGLPDIVADGESGVLVPPRQPGQLADALSELLSNPARRERMAAAAIDRLDQFGVEMITSRFAELYERYAAASALRARLRT
jgi:glycosyltransferase involved in cell wall biosynthesis